MGEGKTVGVAARWEEEGAGIVVLAVGAAGAPRGLERVKTVQGTEGGQVFQVSVLLTEASGLRHGNAHR